MTDTPAAGTPRPIVDRRPEIDVFEEATRRYGGETEKVATATTDVVTWDGVTVQSRWSKAHELETMLLALDYAGAGSRTAIKSVFCDSKATRCYTVEMHVDLDGAIEALEEGFLSAAPHGHNGIYVTGCHRADSMSRSPNWATPADNAEPGRVDFLALRSVANELERGQHQVLERVVGFLEDRDRAAVGQYIRLHAPKDEAGRMVAAALEAVERGK